MRPKASSIRTGRPQLRTDTQTLGWIERYSTCAFLPAKTEATSCCAAALATTAWTSDPSDIVTVTTSPSMLTRETAPDSASSRSCV
jgi:hypothetical protein